MFRPPAACPLIKEWRESPEVAMMKLQSPNTAIYRFVPKDEDAPMLLLKCIAIAHLKKRPAANLLATHQFTAIWIPRAKSANTRHTQTVGYYLDLIGGFTWDGVEQILAKRIMHRLAMHLLSIPRTKVESWSQQIERMNWLGLLDEFGKKEIGERHEVLPSD